MTAFIGGVALVGGVKGAESVRHSGVVSMLECAGGAGAGPVVLPVELPAAWLAVGLPSGGYIGPVMAQLALLRGAAAVFDSGGLLIGGARLVGPAGKVFAFSSAGSAELWAAINKARGLREVEIMAAFEAGPAAVYRGKKAAALIKIAAAVVNAAGKCSVPGIAAALVAESDFCLAKW